MTIAKIKEMHNQVSGIGGTIADYDNEHTAITLLNTIQELEEIFNHTRKLDRIRTRVKELQKQLKEL